MLTVFFLIKLLENLENSFFPEQKKFYFHHLNVRKTLCLRRCLPIYKLFLLYFSIISSLSHTHSGAILSFNISIIIILSELETCEYSFQSQFCHFLPAFFFSWFWVFLVEHSFISQQWRVTFKNTIVLCALLCLPMP